jgi:hypothetical protein
MSTADIIASVAAGITLTSLIVAGVVYRLARRTEAREATTTLMTEWWGEELRDLRRYYRTEFSRNAAVLVCGPDGEALSFREMEDSWPADRGRLRTLCFFFDRVGWLGAAGLVDVDYILAAFQHYVKDVWSKVEPLVTQERTPENNNPVFLCGFEWLHKRSDLSGKDQAHLIRSKFRRPRLISRMEETTWRARIEESETWSGTPRMNPDRRSSRGFARRPTGPTYCATRNAARRQSARCRQRYA